jgi:hypothetical protein
MSIEAQPISQIDLDKILGLGKCWLLKISRLYGRPYLRALADRYWLLSGHSNPQTDTLMQELLKKKPRKLTWCDLYSAEVALMHFLPIVEIKRRYVALHAFLKATNPGPLAPLDQEALDAASGPELRQSTLCLHQEWWRRQLMLNAVEMWRAITAAIIAIIVFAIAICLPAVRLSKMASSGSSSVFTSIAIAGAVGGLFSIVIRERKFLMHRTNELVERQLPALRYQMWLDPILSAIAGAVGALVLYVILASGSIEGSVLPKLREFQDTYPTIIRIWFPQLEVPETAKLMIWSLLAGFSERLVPDLLRKTKASLDVDRAGVQSLAADTGSPNG